MTKGGILGYSAFELSPGSFPEECASLEAPDSTWIESWFCKEVKASVISQKGPQLPSTSAPVPKVFVLCFGI